MTYKKWLITVLSLILIFASLIIALNFYVDHYAIRLSLFSGKKKIQQSVYPDGLNQHIFNAEFIFREPTKFDSFLFGSSRVGAIDVTKIPTGRFYNMSYSQGLPAQHLAILKAFLKKGIKIKSVMIGLDEFCFSLSASTHQKHLLRIMHPDIDGPSRPEIFCMYFFRKPDIKELTLWKNRVLLGKLEHRMILTEDGVNLGWQEKEKIIETAKKPIFDFKISKYKPIIYGQQEIDETFQDIEKLIALSKANNFHITFFITPFYSQLYLNNAEELFRVKERLAQLTDYFDFSGINSVTTNALNYYEESHYRYLVSDMIVARIFGDHAVKVPDGFGVLVTRQNIDRHLKNQRRELEQYLQDQSIK